MDPNDPDAVKMLNLLRYVDGDLGDEATYQAMSDEIGSAEKILYYMEVPAQLFGRIAQGIAGAGRAADARVMVEKPFGTDLASSKQLNDTMHQYFAEDAIFRVDDWLAFDPVENVLFVRFANSVIEPLLNRTSVACRLTAGTWRWAGVPIVIRAGKTMPVTATEVTVTFRDPPHDVFGIEPEHPGDMLTFRIWPETAVSLTLQGKKPGAGWEPQAERLSFAQQPGSDIRPVRPADRRRAGRRPVAVRPPGHRRGRLADRRPGPRRRDPGAPLRPGQLGPEGGRPAAARPGHLARPGRLIPKSGRYPLRRRRSRMGPRENEMWLSRARARGSDNRRQ
jgi:Glucose-6-phosphate dehydrogenase, NAD binding domain/Glucose-6-phosphate dehydrogenase, C-terminal domain